MNCGICKASLTARETKCADPKNPICTNCAARGIRGSRGWGMPTPVNAAEKARQDEESKAMHQADDDEAFLYEEEMRERNIEYADERLHVPGVPSEWAFKKERG